MSPCFPKGEARKIKEEMEASDHTEDAKDRSQVKSREKSGQERSKSSSSTADSKITRRREHHRRHRDDRDRRDKDSLSRRKEKKTVLKKEEEDLEAQDDAEDDAARRMGTRSRIGTVDSRSRRCPYLDTINRYVGNNYSESSDYLHMKMI